VDRARDLPGWPHADRSRFVRDGPHDWHVQEMGAGPMLLCLHGAGASTHTWRDLMPVWARQFRVVCLDLPGQGFTRAGTLRRCGLDEMTADIAHLCTSQGWQPGAIVGHSAGAAIALSLAAGMPHTPRVVGLNAALGHFRGLAAVMFPLLAKLLSMNPLTATVFTLGGPSVPRARRLIEGTGSHLDETGLALYARLIGDRDHVDATLKMMSQWEIDGLLARLPSIAVRTLLVAGGGDLAVPPDTSLRAAARMPECEAVVLDGTGHLAHEEAPDRVARLVERFAGGEAAA
jgi:magnesium chelatase accessory protein